MLETPHVVVGVAIATKLGNPALALPLALGSHFILEKVPHWNPHLNTEKKQFGKVTSKSTKIVILDSILALFIGAVVAYQSLPNINQSIVILAAGFLSVLPDLIEAPYFFLNFDHSLVLRWVKFQKSLQVDASPFWGLTTQLITVIAGLWWIFF